MPRCFHRGIDALIGCLKLTGSLVAAYPVTLLVTSGETGSVNFSEVAEAGIVVVVRALGIVTLRLLAIVFSSLETILVTLVHSLVAIVKNVLTITAYHMVTRDRSPNGRNRRDSPIGFGIQNQTDDGCDTDWAGRQPRRRPCA